MKSQKKKRPNCKSVKRRKSLKVKRKSIKRKDGMFRNLRQDLQPVKLFTDYSPIKSPKKIIPLGKKRGRYDETPEKKTNVKKTNLIKTPIGKKRGREESETPEKNTNIKKAKTTTPTTENKRYDLRSKLTPMMNALRIE